MRNACLMWLAVSLFLSSLRGGSLSRKSLSVRGSVRAASTATYEDSSSPYPGPSILMSRSSGALKVRGTGAAHMLVREGD